MRDRILDFSESALGLSVRLEQLRIRPEAGPVRTVPLSDIAVLVLAHPALHLTQAVLGGLAEHGGVLVTCDANRMPIGMMLPVTGHHMQGLRANAQVTATEPTKKRVWQSIVRSKIEHQALTLFDLHGDDGGLAALAARVKSGDPANVEARAARRYWPLLFQDSQFRRSRDVADMNRYLNYGYAILRALVARAICASGLLPAIGLHHHNRYDAFPLADDLMEPFRPLVDRAAWGLNDLHGPDAPLGPDLKAELVKPILSRYLLRGEKRTLFDILTRVLSSLSRALAGNCRNLLLPDFSNFYQAP